MKIMLSKRCSILICAVIHYLVLSVLGFETQESTLIGNRIRKNEEIPPFAHRDHNTLVSLENWIVIVLFSTIVILSLVFEFILESLHNFLQRRRMKSVIEMLNSVYKELTILGFISFSLFVFTRTGFVRKINDRIFGISQTEKTALEEARKAGSNHPPPTTMVEVFEDVHILVFIVMTFFIIEAVFLTICGFQAMTSYDYFDHKTKDDLKNDIEEQEYAHKDRELIDSLQFFGLKQRFLSPFIPIIAKPTYGDKDYLEFSFSLYLKKTLGKVLSELIELPVSVLILAILVVLLLRPVLALEGKIIIIFMIFISFCLLILTCVVLTIVSKIEAMFKPNHDTVKRFLFVEENYTDVDWIDAPIDKEPLISINFFGEVCHRARALFPFGRPLFLRRLIQALLFFHAIYIAVLIKNTTNIAHGSMYLWRHNWYWSYPFAITPIIISLYLWNKIVRKYVIMTSQDCFASQKTIENVQKECIGEEIRTDTRILNFLIHQADKCAVARMRNSVADYEMSLSEKEKDDMDSIFYVIKEHAGRYNANEVPGGVSLKSFQHMISALRLSPYNGDTAAVTKEWFDVYDTNYEGYLNYTQYKMCFLTFARLNVPQELLNTITKRMSILFDDLCGEDGYRLPRTVFCRYLLTMKPPLTNAQEAHFIKRITDPSGMVISSRLEFWALLTFMRKSLE